MKLNEQQKIEMLQQIEELHSNITLMALNSLKKCSNLNMDINDQLLVVNMGLTKSVNEIINIYPEYLRTYFKKQMVETILGEDKNGKSAT